MPANNQLRRDGSKDDERTPSLSTGRRNSVVSALIDGPIQAAPPTGRRNSVVSALIDGPIQAVPPTSRRNSVAASVFGAPPADECSDNAQPARPLPECLDAQNTGKIYLMKEAAPQGNGNTFSERSGRELWGKLRATLRDSTTRSWLGLTEKANGVDESLIDKSEKKARTEAVIAGMYLDDTRFRQTWDTAQIILLVYIALLVPYRIGFDQNAEPGDFFFIFDVGVDIYFIVDVYLSFNTTRQDSEGKLVWRKRDVRMGYIKGWFTIDLLGCLPLHYLPLLPGVEADSDAIKSNKSVRLLRLARLLKLLRLARINRLLARYEEQLFAFMSSIKMGKTVLFMVFIGHWMCCLWYYAGSQPQEPHELDSDGEVLQGWVLQNFGGVTNFNHTDVMTRYMTSMYYAYATMTTVGYGDISATTYFEKIAAMFSMIIGGFVFGLIVGTLSDLSAQANPLDRVKTKQLSKIVGILQGRTPSVKQRVVKEVRKYFALKYQHETAIDLKPYLFDLPEALRNDVARQLQYISTKGERGVDQQEGILHHVPFFSELDNTSLIMLCLRMKFWSKDLAEIDDDGTRSNDIISEGTYGNEMFVIAKGTCEVITTHGKYKNWPTFKQDHILKTLEDCGLTEGQATAIRAIDESVAQQVKRLPKGWDSRHTTPIQQSDWDGCGIDRDQANKLLDYGADDSRYVLTSATTLSFERQADVAKIFIDAHPELRQGPPRRRGSKSAAGQLWLLPDRSYVRSKKSVCGNVGESGVRNDGWTTVGSQYSAQALTIEQQNRLTDLKRQFPPDSSAAYLPKLASCDIDGAGAAARQDQTGVVKMGQLDQGDFFGESAVLLPHSAKGILRTRSVYGVQSKDMPNITEVHLYVLSNEDLKELEAERPPIKHTLLPYRRQAMANAYRDRFTDLAQGLKDLSEGDAKGLKGISEREESDDPYSNAMALTGIPEHSTDANTVAASAGTAAAAPVSRGEFDALARKVDQMQMQLEEMNKSVGDKLDVLLKRNP